MNEKRRRVELISPQTYTAAGPGFPVATYSAPPVRFTQVTQTRGHAWPQPRAPLTDVGGDFTTSKIVSIVSSDTGVYQGSGFGYSYSGREYAFSPAGAVAEALAAVTPNSDASLITKGATAIARSIPTNPVADAGTFVGELKAGLPRLVGKELFKTKFKDYRKVGSEYLNVQFGWLPIISDLQKFGKATIESDKILKQLHRDSGKNIRRKFTFPDELISIDKVFPSRLAALADGTGGYAYLYKSAGGAPLSTSYQLETKTWFSGCFTYYINLGTSTMDELARKAAEARKLFGVELTPATVWNLAPWSWAVDWEGNIGDVLHNVSRFSQDGLVMRYGYIMQQKTAKIAYTLHRGGRLDSSPATDLTLTVTSQSKVRRGASPFGFGFDMRALTGRQSAILGALAISRGPNRL